MRLVYEASGLEVKVGDTVKIDQGSYKVSYFRAPHKPASSGKVTVVPIDSDQTFGMEYFVGVIGAKWIEREDQS